MRLKKTGLQPLDEKLIRLLQVDGRQPSETLARKLGISPTFLHDAMHGRKEIPLAALTDLGLIRVTRYRRKEAGTNG